MGPAMLLLEEMKCRRKSEDNLKYQPMDVPAITIGVKLGWNCNKDGGCIDGPVEVYSCADKARILLTDEQGGKHCVKF
jgi:hypothetical protein